MSSRRCFKDCCTRKLYGKCECEGITFFCKKHFSSHAENQTFKGHRCIRLNFKPAEEIRQPIIDKLKELKKDIKFFKVDAISHTNEIIKNINTAFGKYIGQINDFEKRCNKIIEILFSGEEVLDTANQDDIESVLKLNASDIKNIEWTINECCPHYNEANEVIQNIFKIPFKPFKKIWEDIIYSDELSFFMDDPKSFATINLNTFQISSKVNLPTQEFINEYTTSCLLPNKSYFYCCNGNTSPGYSFKIDKNKNVKRLQNSKMNDRVDPIFYNNFIYLIGGSYKRAERYDLKQNIWENITHLPGNLNFHCSCNALYKDLILIAGYLIKKILIYSISQNNYKKAQNLVLATHCYKMMLVGNNRVYVFEKGGRTFESAKNNISSWTQIGTNSFSNNLSQSSVVLYKDCLWFVICYDQLWKFDLNSKQTSHAANLNRILFS